MSAIIIHIGLSGVTSHYFWLMCNFYINVTNQSYQLAASLVSIRLFSGCLTGVTSCFEYVLWELPGSATTMPFGISSRMNNVTTWNTFWNSAWLWMIQLQSYITLSSRINKVRRHKMVFFVFFIEFDLYMTLIWHLNDLCTPPQYSGAPTHATLSTQSYVNLLQFKA